MLVQKVSQMVIFSIGLENGQVAPRLNSTLDGSLIKAYKADRIEELTLLDGI